MPVSGQPDPQDAGPPRLEAADGTEVRLVLAVPTAFDYLDPHAVGLLLDADPPRVRPARARVPGQRHRGQLPGRAARHQLLEPPLPRGVPRPGAATTCSTTSPALFGATTPARAAEDPRRLLRASAPNSPKRRCSGRSPPGTTSAACSWAATRATPPARLPGPVDADLHGLLPHPPLVRRRRQRPPRRRQGALLHGPPLRPRARLDRGVPLLRLGRHPGGDLRLAAAVPAQRRQPVQPARQLLRHRGRLVRVGAAVHRLAPALLAAVPRLLPGRRPDLLDPVLGHLQRRRGGPASDRHHAGPHPPGRPRPALRRRPPGRRPTPTSTRRSATTWNCAARTTGSGPHAGALDRHRVSFDVIDDASVQGAKAADGALRIRDLAYTAVLLPSASVLEHETARRLAELLDAGGRVVVVGRPPTQAAGLAGDDSVVAALLDHPRLERVTDAEAGAAAVAEAAGYATGEVPLLVRRKGDAAVALVTGAFPDARTHPPRGHHEIDPARYARTSSVTVRARSPRPRSGTRRPAPAAPDASPSPTASRPSRYPWKAPPPPSSYGAKALRRTPAAVRPRSRRRRSTCRPAGRAAWLPPWTTPGATWPCPPEPPSPNRRSGPCEWTETEGSWERTRVTYGNRVRVLPPCPSARAPGSAGPLPPSEQVLSGELELAPDGLGPLAVLVESRHPGPGRAARATRGW